MVRPCFARVNVLKKKLKSRGAVDDDENECIDNGIIESIRSYAVNETYVEWIIYSNRCDWTYVNYTTLLCPC